MTIFEQVTLLLVKLQMKEISSSKQRSHTREAGLWTLGLWTPGRLDSGRLDSARLDVLTQDAWTLGLWTIGRFDSAQVFSRIFTTTVEHLNFTEHSQLFQIFTGLYIEKTLFFIDKAKNNFEIKTIK